MIPMMEVGLKRAEKDCWADRYSKEGRGEMCEVLYKTEHKLTSYACFWAHDGPKG